MLFGIESRIAQEKAIVTVLPALHHHGKEGYKHCNDQVIYSLFDGFMGCLYIYSRSKVVNLLFHIYIYIILTTIYYRESLSLLTL